MTLFPFRGAKSPAWTFGDPVRMAFRKAIEAARVRVARIQDRVPRNGSVRKGKTTLFPFRGAKSPAWTFGDPIKYQSAARREGSQ